MSNLNWSVANSKLKKLYKHREGILSDWLNVKHGRKFAQVYSLDLQSGVSCPMAKHCFSVARERDDGSRFIQDGKHTEFRCFSASQEAQYTGVYRKRRDNFETLRPLDRHQIATLLHETLPLDAGIVRAHVAGDMFKESYFRAWLDLAKARPNVLFYAYTKMLNLWVKHRPRVERLPNFVLTASRGGKLDHLIETDGLREARVILSPDQASDLGPIDDDDSHAANPATRHDSFRLLIHGTQPPGSAASKALQILKKAKV